MKHMKNKPENWVEMYGNLLYRFAFLRVQNEGVAEDLVQETFLAGLKSHKNFKGSSAEKSWMVGILKHKILDYYRKMARNQEKQITNDENNEDIQVEIDESSKHEWMLDPAEQLERQEFRETLMNCLKKIPPKMAQVFTMREIDQMSTEEICKELNLSSTNVWVILYRARVALQNCLELRWFKENLHDKRSKPAMVRTA